MNGTISERTRVKLELPELVDGLRYTRKVGGALYLHCQECGEVIADCCDPYFRLSQTKWMHESGMHHHTFYICRGDENELPRPN